MHLNRIAVVGPGGNVGSAVIRELLKDSRFQIRTIARLTSNYNPPLSSPNIEKFAVDFADSPSLVTALQNQDALVCCVPGSATKFAPQKLLIDAAIAAGVKLFFASEFGSNILSPHYEIFPTQFVGDKIKVRKYLEERASACEIAYTALNGGPFFDLWLLKGFAGFDISARTAKIYGSGDNLACWTPIPVVASAVVNMLRNPDAILNRAIFISGVRDLTQNAILAALESETGNEFEIEHIDLKPIKEDALAALANGDYIQATKGLTLNSNFNEQESKADFWGIVENELVGVRAVTVQEAVRTAIEQKN
ncbi:hypothetical protein MMC29_000772 [Sticta canariensis]|nr:hypothetical protein [Sticta canariensis]